MKRLTPPQVTELYTFVGEYTDTIRVMSDVQAHEFISGHIGIDAPISAIRTARKHHGCTKVTKKQLQEEQDAIDIKNLAAALLGVINDNNLLVAGAHYHMLCRAAGVPFGEEKES